jgi:hypothetical protein
LADHRGWLRTASSSSESTGARGILGSSPWELSRVGGSRRRGSRHGGEAQIDDYESHSRQNQLDRRVWDSVAEPFEVSLVAITTATSEAQAAHRWGVQPIQATQVRAGRLAPGPGRLHLGFETYAIPVAPGYFPAEILCRGLRALFVRIRLRGQARGC